MNTKRSFIVDKLSADDNNDNQNTLFDGQLAQSATSAYINVIGKET